VDTSLAIFLCFVVVLFYFAGRAAARNYFRSADAVRAGYESRLDDAWARAAQRLGARLVKKRRAEVPRAIAAELHGQRVRLDHTTGTEAATRARASARHAPGLVLSIERGRVLGTLTAVLGAQKLTSGDAAFDAAFTVTTNDPGLARAWLDADTRRALLASKNTRFQLRDGEVTAVRLGVRHDARVIERLAIATAALAGRGRTLERWWRGRAAAANSRLQSDAEGRWRIEIDDRTVPIRIETRLPEAEAATCTRVVARVVDRGADPYDLERTNDDSEQDVASELLPPGYRFATEGPSDGGRRLSALRGRIAELAPRRIACDGDEVTLELDDVDGDADKLDAAIELATALAARQKGPYR
jgi:hypothetical protein